MAKRAALRLNLGIVIALALLFGVGLGTAYGDNCTINTMPSWDGSITFAYQAAAQIFMAPSAHALSKNAPRETGVL